MRLRLVSPLGANERDRPARARGAVVLRDAVVGLLANSKANSGELLELVADELRRRHGIATVVPVMKPHPSVPADDASLARLARCDVVLTAIGDCGSCSTCTMHDGLALERRGVPTVVMLTDPFTPAGRAIAALDGDPDYEFLVLPHPTAGLHDDALRAVAARAVEGVERLLGKRS